MSAEIRPNDPAPPDPGPIRKKKFTIKLMMAGILVISLPIGLFANLVHTTTRNQKTMTDFFAWTDQLAKDNPSVVFGGFTAGTGGDWFGASFHYEGKYTTPTRRAIEIDFNHHDRSLGRTGRLVLSSQGRSITWPFEDVVRGRKINLKAEFPEAVR